MEPNHRYPDDLYKCLNGTENTPNKYHLEPNVGVHTEMAMTKVTELYKKVLLYIIIKIKTKV